MTTREKTTAKAFAGILGVVLVWQVLAVSPFASVRRELAERQNKLKELDRDLDDMLDQLDDNLYAFSQVQTDEELQEFSDDLYRMTELHITQKLKSHLDNVDLRVLSQQAAPYQPRKTRRRTELGHVEFSRKLTGDLTDLMQFILKLQDVDPLLYVTKLVIDPKVPTSRVDDADRNKGVEADITLERVVLPTLDELFKAFPSLKKPLDQIKAPQRSSAEGQVLLAARWFGTTPVPPPDADGDGVPDDRDNCPNTPNRNQRDSNRNGTGDACEETPEVIPDKPPPPVEEGNKDRDIIVVRGGTFGPVRREIWVIKDEARRASSADSAFDRRQNRRSGRSRGRRPQAASNTGTPTRSGPTWYSEGDEFDDGILVHVHPLGGIARRKGKDDDKERLYFYPYGKTLAESMPLDEADEYPEAQLAMEALAVDPVGPMSEYEDESVSSTSEEIANE